MCQSIVQLGEQSRCIDGERNSSYKTPRQACLKAERTTSRRRSLGTRKSHVTGISSTFSSRCTETRPAINLAGPGRRRSAFREALDEAKEQLLADVRRGGRSLAVTARSKDILPASRRHLSVHDESGKISISYKEVDQSLEGSRATKGGKGEVYHFNDTSGSTRTLCGGGERSEYTADSRGGRSSSNPEESYRKQTTSGKKTPGNNARLSASRDSKLRYQACGNFDEGTRRENVSPRRAKTVSIETKQSGSKGKALEVNFILNDGKDSEGSTGGFSTSIEAKNTCIISNNSRGRDHRNANSSPGRRVKPTHTRSGSLHHALRTKNMEKNPTNLHHSEQTSVASEGCASFRLNLEGCEQLEQWKRASSARDSGRLLYRRREQQSAAAVRREAAATRGRSSWVRELQAADGERCDQEVKAEKRQKHAAHEEGSRHYDHRKERNRQSYDKIREEGTEEDAEGQGQWCRRGRMLWSTHAEPVARILSSGSRLVGQRTIRSHSTPPAMRPYHGLYARSLQANGIDPANFRASPCCCSCDAGMNCAAGRMIVDDSLLWRGPRGGDSRAAQRTRAPTDGLSDRLEAGRVLDSLNRRAELLGTTPPTLLRAKAAWMENPGDPTYM